MSIIYILIPVAVLLTALGIYLFFWAVKAEQFDDLEKQGMSILFDDEPVNNINEEKPEDEIESTNKKQETPK
ncbi:cbb3-type cytochrome oxidase assembly protein CcoS [Colwellia psychrerythraea]|uniref:Cytochrome oxidase maturation protein, cbb3-type n=1 Tax=Colwellia psychrerythraea TaxID=28229 RepID=A0A099KHU6_COLPS|nr:cbb3-type cytochrome oxidase assembly protein CcoS [Colwellia psychrerythraea]KGJ89941.1 cytochrome oxidase maturation protein, cbb3-type [Colwellia psychrerythraea]